jgi:ABC-2 type transport system permease protein
MAVRQQRMTLAERTQSARPDLSGRPQPTLKGSLATSLNHVTLIASKELKTYFASWMAYALIAVYLLIGGFLFWVIVTRTATSLQLSPLFQELAVILMFIVPLLTMRLLSEEKSTGTVELLFTSPVTDWQVVLGKFFGVFGVHTMMLLLTSHFPIMLFRWGSVDKGIIWSSYLSLWLVGGVFLSVGLWASSLSDSQVVSGFITFGALLALWLINYFGFNAQNLFGDFCRELSVLSHLDDMTSGVIDTRNLIYTLSFTGFFLFWTKQVLESRKWK